MSCCTSAGMAGRTEEPSGAATAAADSKTTLKLLRNKEFITTSGLLIWMLGESRQSPSRDDCSRTRWQRRSSQGTRLVSKGLMWKAQIDLRAMLRWQILRATWHEGR